MKNRWNYIIITISLINQHTLNAFYSVCLHSIFIFFNVKCKGITSEGSAVSHHLVLTVKIFPLERAKLTSLGSSFKVCDTHFY